MQSPGGIAAFIRDGRGHIRGDLKLGTGNGEIAAFPWSHILSSVSETRGLHAGTVEIGHILGREQGRIIRTEFIDLKSIISAFCRVIIPAALHQEDAADLEDLQRGSCTVRFGRTVETSQEGGPEICCLNGFGFRRFFFRRFGLGGFFGFGRFLGLAALGFRGLFSLRRFLRLGGFFGFGRFLGLR